MAATLDTLPKIGAPATRALNGAGLRVARAACRRPSIGSGQAARHGAEGSSHHWGGTGAARPDARRV